MNLGPDPRPKPKTQRDPDKYLENDLTQYNKYLENVYPENIRYQIW